MNTNRVRTEVEAIQYKSCKNKVQDIPKTYV
jgi:hypothetical protein